MASVEHCLYCFEALSAHLANLKPMTLLDIQKSWKEYVSTPEAAKADNIAKQMPAFRRLAANGHDSSDSGTSSPSSSSSISLAAETPSTSVAPSDDGNDDDDDDGRGNGAFITQSPLFVTWNTVSRGGRKSLRGCIGTFEDQDLADGLASYAITSAIHDTRFDPVEPEELPSLDVSVTLLTDFEECDDVHDWTLGVHGLRISFFYHGRRYGATYLPDVASEQGWTKDETLVSLMRKAGWTGRKEKWREVDVKCVRYQGKKESLDYTVYKRWRDWVGKNGGGQGVSA
jgi:AMME syndrome candidate gene 1 protein